MENKDFTKEIFIDSIIAIERQINYNCKEECSFTKNKLVQVLKKMMNDIDLINFYLDSSKPITIKDIYGKETKIYNAEDLYNFLNKQKKINKNFN